MRRLAGELGKQPTDTPFDVVADGPDLLGGLAGRVREFPVEATGTYTDPQQAARNAALEVNPRKIGPCRAPVVPACRAPVASAPQSAFVPSQRSVRAPVAAAPPVEIGYCRFCAAPPGSRSARHPQPPELLAEPGEGVTTDSEQRCSRAGIGQRDSGSRAKGPGRDALPAPGCVGAAKKVAGPTPLGHWCSRGGRERSLRPTCG